MYEVYVDHILYTIYILSIYFFFQGMVLRRGFEEAVKDDQDFVFDPAWSPTES